MIEDQWNASMSVSFSKLIRDRVKPKSTDPMPRSMVNSNMDN